KRLYLVVHYGANQEQACLAIDQHRHPLVLDNLVTRAGRVGPGHVIGQAGAALGLHADAQQASVLARVVQPAQPLRGGIGQGHHRRQGAGGARCGTRAHWWVPSASFTRFGDQYMFSCNRASSVIRLGSQGGSHTVSTSQSVTPGTDMMASCTCTGSSCALGQAGAVRVISTFTRPSSWMSIV